MTDATCSGKGCGNPLFARGWCRGHWRRWRKTGDAQADVPIRKWTPRSQAVQCSFDRCPEPVVARGWCHTHYKRWQVHGDPAVNKRRVAKPCSVPTCGLTSEARGLCRGHSERLKRTGGLRPEIPLVRGGWRPPKEICSADGCRKFVKALGLCRAHYGEKRRRDAYADPVKRDALRAYHRNWHAAWRERDPQAVREAYNAWRASNLLIARANEARRRLRKLNAPAIPFTASQLAARMAYWGNRCWICSGPFEAIDHVKPLNKGGWHALMNLRPACNPCNSRKRDIWPFAPLLAIGR